MVDVCNLAIEPIKNTVGKEIDNVLGLLSDQFNDKIVSQFQFIMDAITNLINDVIAALERGMNGFTSVLNDISLDIRELFILVNSAGLGSLMSLVKLVLLPYIMNFFSTIGTGISVKLAGQIAIILVMIPFIGNVYTITKTIIPL